MSSHTPTPQLRTSTTTNKSLDLEDDFDQFWAVASKLVPLPSPPSPAPSRSQTPTPSTIASDGRVPEANAMRSVPMRVYLPEGAPVLQDVVPPLSDGQSAALIIH